MRSVLVGNDLTLYLAEGIEPTVCPENPLVLTGQPIGMYHCPWCGCMVIAGFEHGPHELWCLLGLWDEWAIQPPFWTHEQDPDG